MIRFIAWLIVCFFSTLGFFFIYYKLSNAVHVYRLKNILLFIFGVLLATFLRYYDLNNLSPISYFLFYPIFFNSLKPQSFKSLIFYCSVIFIYGMFLDLLSMLIVSLLIYLFDLNVSVYWLAFIMTFVVFALMILLGLSKTVKKVTDKLYEMLQKINYPDFILIVFAIFILIIGIIITILIQKFFEYDKKNQKILISISIILLSSIYVFTFRPYAISFGYIFLALIVWLILKNKDNLIKNKFNIGLGIVTIVFSIICGFIVVKFFDNNNNEYLKITDSGISPMFSYLYNFLLPFYNFEGRELLGSVITVFPLPMIISLYYLYKKENHIEFLLPMVIVMVFGSVYCMSGFPEIISKVTMLSQVLPLRALAGLQIANLLVMFYFFGNIQKIQ